MFTDPGRSSSAHCPALAAHGFRARRREEGEAVIIDLSRAAARSAGAHPYLTTPEHTARARELIGPEALLAPEHKVVLTTDAVVTPEQAPIIERTLAMDPNMVFCLATAKKSYAVA